MKVLLLRGRSTAGIREDVGRVFGKNTVIGILADANDPLREEGDLDLDVAAKGDWEVLIANGGTTTPLVKAVLALKSVGIVNLQRDTLEWIRKSSPFLGKPCWTGEVTVRLCADGRHRAEGDLQCTYVLEEARNGDWYWNKYWS